MPYKLAELAELYGAQLIFHIFSPQFQHVPSCDPDRVGTFWCPDATPRRK